MSARKLHRIPCPVCKDDTLHHALKCCTCGNQVESGATATQRVIAEAASKGKKHQARVARVLMRRSWQRWTSSVRNDIKKGHQR